MNPTNYRPTLLMTSFSKVFEKALYVRLIEHFYSNKLLLGNQFGCRKCAATEDATFKLIIEFFKCFKNKTMAGSIFCNLEKAVDSVNQNLLLSKLSHYGISGIGKLLLESFLQNRNHQADTEHLNAWPQPNHQFTTYRVSTHTLF